MTKEKPEALDALRSAIHRNRYRIENEAEMMKLRAEERERRQQRGREGAERIKAQPQETKREAHRKTEGEKSEPQRA